MDKQEFENPPEKELNEDFARIVEAGYEASLTLNDNSSISFAEQLERQAEQNRTASFQYQLLKRTRRVWATNILVAVNVIVYVIQLTQGIDWLSPEVTPLLKWGANYAPLTFAGEWWRIVTCMFLHGGILHLIINLYALRMLGNFVERLVGTWSFLALYFATGIAGSLTSLYWHSSETVGVGASGAICGIFGVLIGYVFWQRRSFPRVFVKAVRNSIILVIMLTIVLGYFIENVDQAAHLGGTILGVPIGIFLSQPFGSFEKSIAWKRAIVLALFGIVGTAFAAKTFPEAPVDRIEARNQFVRAERERDNTTRAVFKILDQLEKDNKIGESEIVEVVEDQIIHPWKKILKKFESLKNVPDEQKEYVEKRIESLQLRLDAWQSLLEAIKVDNFPEKKQKLDDWDTKWEKAEEFDKSLRESNR